MKRNIIQIDEEKCNGCGLCVNACHEGALQMINGKAKLITDSYCDGLGDCLPECPTGAIQIIERDADAYDEVAVLAKMAGAKAQSHTHSNAHMHNSANTHNSANKHSNDTAHDAACSGGGCPGSRARSIEKKAEPTQVQQKASLPSMDSQLRQWPVQIKLVPVKAPYLHNAHLLVAADCTAFAYGNIHNDFMKDKITLIGCPKLDEGDYSDKLAAILQNNEVQSVHVLRMEVPCCGGITQAVKSAMKKSGKMIPWQVTTISTSGEILI